jgi:flagellar motor switch protein FliN
MTAPGKTALESFVQSWKTEFAKVLTQLGAADVTAPELEAAELKLAAPEDSALLAAGFAGGGCLKGQLQWSCEKTAALQCAQLLMSEPVDPAAEFTATHADGYLEFLRQIAGGVAVAWTQAQGAPAELIHQTEMVGAFATAFSAAFRLESDKGKDLAMRLDLDAEMLAAVSAVAEETPQAMPEAQAGAATEVEVEAEAEADTQRTLPTNLDLILDVQLDATIRFGEREMLLQDVFGLMPGAVVQLDQMVNEPAELLVAGRLVAKGEVVVVDGNFGLRVTEVLSPTQRVAALSLG